MARPAGGERTGSVEEGGGPGGPEETWRSGPEGGGAGAVIFGVVGFDEKFHIRCAMRVFTRYPLRRVVFLRPWPAAGRMEEERVERALESLRRLIREYMEAEVEVVDVAAGDFAAAFMTARRLVRRALDSGAHVVLCLSGGMRYLNLALFAAAISLPRDDARASRVTVESDLEGGQGHVSIPLAPLKALPTLREKEQRVLELLWERGEAGPTDVAESLGIAKSTAWKILETLKEAGLAVKADGKYRPSWP